MTLDDMILAEAEKARDRMEAAQDEVERARADYHRAIRRLHAAGGTLREIAESFGLSHQRVHQVVESGSMIEPDSPPDLGLLHCSFCGLDQKHVKKLIAGPGKYICDECTGAIAGMAAGHTVETRASLFPVAEDDKVQCSFCGKKRAKVQWMTTGGHGGRICNECTGLCEDILREEIKGEEIKGAESKGEESKGAESKKA